MINGIINAFIGRMVMFGFVMCGVGAFAAYDHYDKGAHYVPVQARITDIKDMCIMEKQSGRRREYSETISLAELAVKTSPKWQGFDIRHNITVAYEYISPVDRKTHAGARVLGAYPDGKKLSRGEVYQIRASKTDANKSREI